VVNGVMLASITSDPLAQAMVERGREALAVHAAFLRALPRVHAVALRPHNVLGIAAIRTLFAEDVTHAADDTEVVAPLEIPGGTLDLAALVDRLATEGRGVIMTMGKGGVGKTTIAASIALALARRGHRVHLSTTDPAAHVARTLGSDVKNLSVARIDPQAETRAYVEEVMQTRGSQLDAESRALLEEDLRSPCTEEIAVFRAFARTVAQGAEGFVVLDTAPTGHTLLLLDATQAYHRELGRQSRDDLPPEVAGLLPRLRNPQFTRVLLVTLPEATPVHEAAALESDLARAGIAPFGWVINQSLADAGVCDPLLAARAQAELPYIREVLERHGPTVALVPCVAREPVGPDGLAQLIDEADDTEVIPPRDESVMEGPALSGPFARPRI